MKSVQTAGEEPHYGTQLFRNHKKYIENQILSLIFFNKSYLIIGLLFNDY